MTHLKPLKSLHEHSPTKHDARSTVMNSLRPQVLESKNKLTLKTCIALVVCFPYLALWAQITDDDELLHVDEAFKLHVYLDDGESIRAVWQVAKGYYLYQHGFKIKRTKGVDLDELEIPSGTKKKDPIFGDVEVYYERVSISVPIKNIPENSQVGIGFQGCAEDRYCYAPQIRWFEFRDNTMVASDKDKNQNENVKSTGDILLSTPRE